MSLWASDADMIGVEHVICTLIDDSNSVTSGDLALKLKLSLQGVLHYRL